MEETRGKSIDETKQANIRSRRAKKYKVQRKIKKNKGAVHI
jgi:hypothetical protein